MNKTIYLIACGVTKAPCVSKAKELYLGELFKKSRTYVESKGAKLTGSGDRWFILSAKWGLLHPDATIRPYDETLNNKTKDYIYKWALQVCLKLLGVLKSGDTVVILAGVKYREFLVRELEAKKVIVEVPLVGLGIGQQLAWLKNKIDLTNKEITK